MSVKSDSKGRQIGFAGPTPLPVDTTAVERAPYRRRSTESSELLAALGHPIRIAVLLNVRRGDDTSPSDLRKGVAAIQDLDVDVSLVAHHVKKLAKADLLRPTRIVRGNRALKQMYELTERGEVMARICVVAEKMLAADGEPTGGRP